MGFAEEMTNLGENIMGALDARINFLGQNIVDVKNAKLDAQSLIKKFGKEHKTMAKKQASDLGTFVGDLEEFVEKQQGKFQKDHKAMARKQGASLGAFVENLTDTVGDLCQQFNTEQAEVHKDCQAAHQSWKRISKAMANKRKNAKASITAATKKAARTH